MRRWSCVFPLLAAGLLLVGCQSGSGTLSLSVTDAPVDNATSVVVDVVAIEADLIGGGQVLYTFPQPQQIDLLQVQEGLRTPLITNWSLPAGEYQRLVLYLSANGSGTDSYIVLNDGSQHALIPAQSAPGGLPAGSDTLLAINAPFSIPASTAEAYVIDFDARKSVLPPSAGSTAYRLQPLGRMVAELGSGNVIGVVPNPLVTPGCTPAVYVFAGAGASPTDINDSAPPASQPLSESAVRLDKITGEYDFTAAYLPPGNYTLAFTCQAAQDDPAAADNIAFTFIGSVPVVAGQTIRTVLQSGP